MYQKKDGQLIMREELIQIGIDYNDLIARLGNNEIFVERFLKNFLSDKTIDTIKIDYQANDMEQLKRSVHTLKGISANLSMCSLFQICSDWMQDLRSEKYENNNVNYQICIQEYTKITNGLKTIFGEA